MTATKRGPAQFPLLWAGGAFALLLISQHAALADLFVAWQMEEYSHGILIPFIALFLAWHLLVEHKPAAKPSWQGLAWLAVAGLLQLLAQLSAFNTAAEYGLIIALTGLSLAFLGRAATRVIAPALFYLIFAIPLPHLLQANLSQSLQLWSSSLGVWPLDLAGIPVFQQGNVIDLGGYKLQVVDACSGLRYLFPLMSFGYLVAFLLKDRWWKKLVLFFSTIPIAIGLNSLRIAFIGITVDLWGEKMATGFTHDFEGWSIFLVCVALLMGETWLLLRIGKRGHFRYEYLGRAQGRLFSNRIALEKPGIAALIIVLFFSFLFGTNLINHRDEIIPSHPPLSSFPLAIGEWHGQSDNLPPDVLESLHLSDYWLANYARAKGPSVNLYIAYFASQRAGAENHSPSNCIPGGGWQIENSRTQTLQLPSGKNLKFTRLLIRRGEVAQLVYYWFDERGRDLTETTIAKWYLLQDSITMHRTDGALIRLTTPLAEGENETDAAKRLNGFLALSYPQVRSFIPGASAN